MIRGLLVDFGGVLTTDVFAGFQEFCEREGLAPDTLRDRFMSDPEARGLLGDLETGALSVAEFEPRFGAVLGVEPAGLVDRIFAGIHADPPMIEAVRAAKQAGVRTGLLSNSWGAERYDRSTFPDLFDVAVISEEVRMRKPDPAIYEIAAERMELPAAQIVFVDDLPGNLKPARALGMVTLRHERAEATIPELEALLGVSLRGSGRAD